MNKYLIICYEEWENGVCILPRIETTIEALSLDDAKKKTFSKYGQYREIGIFDWNY